MMNTTMMTTSLHHQAIAMIPTQTIEGMTVNSQECNKISTRNVNKKLTMNQTVKSQEWTYKRMKTTTIHPPHCCAPGSANYHADVALATNNNKIYCLQLLPQQQIIKWKRKMIATALDWSMNPLTFQGQSATMMRTTKESHVASPG